MEENFLYVPLSREKPGEPETRKECKILEYAFCCFLGLSPFLETYTKLPRADLSSVGAEAWGQVEAAVGEEEACHRWGPRK